MVGSQSPWFLWHHYCFCPLIRQLRCTQSWATFTDLQHWHTYLLLRPIVILSSRYRFQCGFHIKVVYVFLVSSILATWPAQRDFTVLTVGFPQVMYFIERWTGNAVRIVADTCKASIGKPEGNVPVQSSRRWKDDSKLHVTEIDEVVS
jgi:hypothetical protein